MGRAEKVALTKEARRIIAEKVTPQLPWALPPEISSQECLKAIEHAGGGTVRHRGKDLHITEIVTRGTRWWSGDLRLPPVRFSNSGTPGAPLRCNFSTIRHSERYGVNLHFTPPDGRSTRYDRQDFAFPSQRLLAVLNVLFKYACARQAARASS